MKRRLIAIIALLALAAVAAGGWAWLRARPEQAARFLRDRGLSATQAERIVALGGSQAVDTGPPEPLRASGSIEGDEVEIVSEFAGRIISLTVEEGDSVRAGQAVVQLDAVSVEAQLAQARAAVSAAQANLATVQAGTPPAQILAARAAIRQAEAQRDAARTAWEDAQALVDRPQDLDAQIVQARAAADVAAVQIEQAQAGVKAAEVERDRYRAQGTLEEKGLYRVYHYQVVAAQAALGAAREKKAGADRTLAALQALRANPLPLLSQVHAAEQRTYVAEAGVNLARARLAELVAGPTAEDLAVARAQVARAEAAVSSLVVQRNKRRLLAPIDGIVVSRSARTGETAIAGAALLTVANLDKVRLTVYIPEGELGRLSLGQTVEVSVDSYPGETFGGTVAYIGQQAEFTPKNVQTEQDRLAMVFAVHVRLPNADHRLKLGMPADVVIR